jgi:vitamin B12 transporter
MHCRHSVFRQSVLAAALLCVIAPAAFADEAVVDQATDLDEVVVTATRTAQTQDETLAAVTVITREDIERLQPSSLQDLLRGQPGLTISNNGGAGKESSVFLRGTEADHVLVLIDGIRIGSVTAGKAALQDIPVDQIERIEIVRGPFSSLYGADALGGVIQIFTRRPHKAFDPNFSVAGGSYGTWRGSAGVSGRSETSDERSGWYSAQAAYEHTDGIDAHRGDADTDPDGYYNRSLSLAAGHRFSRAWDVEGRVLRAEGHNDYDGSFQNQSDVIEQAIGARVRYAPTNGTTLTLNLGRSDDRSDNFLDSTPAGTFDSRRDSGSLQGDFGIGSGLLSVGYDWRRDEVDSTTAYLDSTGEVVTRRYNRAMFGQWQGRFDAHSLQLSLRRDDDSQFGGKTTGSALWGWDFTDALRLTASYGTAYKAPSFNELYFPFFGNPDLKPEESRSFELGLRGQHGWGNWTLNAFDTKADQLIATFCTPDWICFPVNVDSARIRGTEATIETTIAGWAVRGTATWLDPRDDGSDKLLRRRTRTSGRVDVDRRFGAFSVGATVDGNGYRYEDAANLQRLGGYATTDLRVGYTFAGAWTLQLNANNVFDKRYETAALYNQPGRNYLLSLRYRAR